MDKIGEPAVKVRAGRLGRPVLAVLIASTLLVIGALAAIYIGYFAGPPWGELRGQPEEKSMALLISSITFALLRDGLAL